MALLKRRTPRPDPDSQSGASGSAPDWHALYEIENPAEVDAYVAEHPSVVGVLDDAPREIRAVFGNTAQPRLRLTGDPEEGDNWLTVKIPLEDVGPTALPLVDAFDERWWLERMTTTDATVVFDVTER
jgi:hypothetical protein